jgi:hypothetical protein
MWFKIAALALILGSPNISSAGDDSDEWASPDTLKETQNFLQNPQQLEAFANYNPEAWMILEQLKAMTNNDPKKMQEINQMASGVFTEAVKNNKGSASAGLGTMGAGDGSSKGIFESLSPEQQAKIRELSKEYDAQKSRQPASMK